MIDYAQIGERLKAAREAAGLSIYEAAAKASLTIIGIEKLETDECRSNALFAVLSYARAVGLDPSDLFRPDGSPTRADLEQQRDLHASYAKMFQQDNKAREAVIRELEAENARLNAKLEGVGERVENARCLYFWCTECHEISSRRIGWGKGQPVCDNCRRTRSCVPVALFRKAPVTDAVDALIVAALRSESDALPELTPEERAIIRADNLQAENAQLKQNAEKCLEEARATRREARATIDELKRERDDLSEMVDCMAAQIGPMDDPKGEEHWQQFIAAGKRKPGRSKLVYDKEKRTIVKVDPTVETDTFHVVYDSTGQHFGVRRVYDNMVAWLSCREVAEAVCHDLLVGTAIQRDYVWVTDEEMGRNGFRVSPASAEPDCVSQTAENETPMDDKDAEIARLRDECDKLRKTSWKEAAEQLAAHRQPDYETRLRDDVAMRRFQANGGEADEAWDEADLFMAERAKRKDGQS